MALIQELKTYFLQFELKIFTVPFKSYWTLKFDQNCNFLAVVLIFVNFSETWKFNNFVNL